MPVMDPALTVDAYQRVLRALYGIVRAWEDWLEVHAPESLRTEAASRKRSPLLAADLKFFHQQLPSARPNLHLPETEAGLLGAMYVMEGSTLGGQYIARHVEQTLHLHPGEGNAYFLGYREKTADQWRALQAILRSVPEHHTDQVIAGAKAMFEQFRLWMVQELN